MIWIFIIGFIYVGIHNLIRRIKRYHPIAYHEWWQRTHGIGVIWFDILIFTMKNKTITNIRKGEEF